MSAASFWRSSINPASASMRSALAAVMRGRLRASVGKGTLIPIMTEFA